MTVFELGITARGIYVQTEECMSMLPLDEDGSGGGATAELIQSTLDDFGGPIIAGKTHSEILSMSTSNRWWWYKKITPKERGEAMRIVDMTRRAKLVGKTNPNWQNGAKISGKNNPMKRPEVRAKFVGKKNPAKRPEVRAKISEMVKKRWEDPEFRASNSGENSSNWQNGVSFEPYCPRFNESLKESIRNVYDRNCLSCGKSALFNGKRLSIHHLDGDKLQGCNGKKWALVPLCNSCHMQLHRTKEQKAIKLEFLLAIKAEEYRRSGVF